MKRKDLLMSLVVASVGALMIGCGSDNGMTKAEIDGSKASAPMTDAQKAKMQQAMANGNQAAVDSEIAWAKANPDKVAAVNAARAQAGKPPLGTK